MDSGSDSDRPVERDSKPEAGSARDRYGENHAHYEDPSYFHVRDAGLSASMGYHLAAHLTAERDETWSLNTNQDSSSELDSLAYDIGQVCSVSPPSEREGTVGSAEGSKSAESTSRRRHHHAF